MNPENYNNDCPSNICLLIQYEYCESKETIFWLDFKPAPQDEKENTASHLYFI